MPSSLPGRVTTGARASDTSPATFLAPGLRCWAKFVRGLAYDGEYGFDWMDWTRDPSPQNTNNWLDEAMGVPIKEFEYCYDAAKQQYVEVAKDPYLKRRLQEQYRQLPVYEEPYYIAWLSVRPGQEVKLRLKIEALNTEAATATDFLTFGPHASYQVTANGQVNEAIRLAPTATAAAGVQLVDITVKCLHACPATELKVFDEEGQQVGQLNIVDNTKTYRLPIRVIYLVKQGAASSTDLLNLKNTFAALDLKKYLNEKSLNQAQIQVDFENTNQSFDLTFDEDVWALEGFFDKTNNWFTDRTYLDEEGESIEELILSKFLNAYSSRYESRESIPFRGVLLFITNLPFDGSEDLGGVSLAYPESARHCIIFKSDLKHLPTYAHEIGHTLGLEHSFWALTEQKNYISTLENINGDKDANGTVRKRGLRDVINSNKSIIDRNRERIKIRKSKYIDENKNSIISGLKALKNPDVSNKTELKKIIYELQAQINKDELANSEIQKTITDAERKNKYMIDWV